MFGFRTILRLVNIMFSQFSLSPSTDLSQTLNVDPTMPVAQHKATNDKITGDTYVPLELKNGAYVTAGVENHHNPLPFSDLASHSVGVGKLEPLPSLHFVPYYFRANRGGKGHMRVGLRRWVR